MLPKFSKDLRLSWNIAHRPQVWTALLDSNADIALLQEAYEPPFN